MGRNLALRTRGKRQLRRCVSNLRRIPLANWRTEFTRGRRVTHNKAEQIQIATFQQPAVKTTQITGEGTCSTRYTASRWDQLNFISQGNTHSQKLSIMLGITGGARKSPDQPTGGERRLTSATEASLLYLDKWLLKNHRNARITGDWSNLRKLLTAVSLRAAGEEQLELRVQEVKISGRLQPNKFLLRHQVYSPEAPGRKHWPHATSPSFAEES